MLEMAHIDLYLDSPHQASASYPFSSINASVDVDAEAGCGHFTLASHFSKTPKLASNNGDEMIGLLKLNFQLKMNVRLTRVATGDASLRRTDQLIVIVTMDTKDNSVTVIEFFTISPHKNGNIANFVLAMPFKILIEKTNKVRNLER